MTTEYQRTVMGFCPECRRAGLKRLEGTDTCENNHRYPSREALFPKPVREAQIPVRKPWKR